jgi:hypothetical protein
MIPVKMALRNNPVNISEYGMFMCSPNEMNFTLVAIRFPMKTKEFSGFLVRSYKENLENMRNKELLFGILLK